MKRFALFLLALGIYDEAAAQVSDAGISLGLGITRFRNINTSERRPDLNPEISLGPVIGIRGDHFFTTHIALTAEADFSLVNQKYEGDSSGMKIFSGRDEAGYVEIPLLFEYVESNIYAEIGPKISIFTGGKGSFQTDPSSPEDYSNLKLNNGFSDLVLSGVAGAGARFELSKNLILQAGVRVSYSFTDATKQISPDDYFTLYDENKLGLTSKYAHLAVGSIKKYNYKTTTLIRGDLLVSLSYHLPEGK